MVPTKERNVPAVFLKYKSEGILFDCGEGTQRQMNITGINRNKVTKILLTHWHGDHVSGVIGLLQTIGNREINPKIMIFGPKGTKKRVKCLMDSIYFDVQVNLKIVEIDEKKPKTVFNGKEFKIVAANMVHNTPCISYAFIEKDRRNIDKDFLKKNKIGPGPHLKQLSAGKSITYKGKEIDVNKATYVIKGKKISYVVDTEVCNNAIEIAEGSDILICESTYSSKLANKAREFRHMTSKDAAMIANKANVKKLILTHFSQRYKNCLEIQEDAQTYFDNVICAEDFMKISL
tara:strand:- start:13354 stop:14223 length:870 start_codon:yes stop_codon:yes gene_type:complete